MTSLVETDALPDNVEPLTDGFAFSPTGLVVRGKPSYDECVRVGRLLPIAERSVQFAMGDFINYLEERFGEAASQIIDPENGWALETCRNYAWVAKSVPAERRRCDRLGIKHHVAVATLTPEQQVRWLNWAANDGQDRPRTVQHMVAAMRASEEMPTTYWLLVAASSEEDLTQLQAQLEAMGRSCKAHVKRMRKEQES